LKHRMSLFNYLILNSRFAVRWGQLARYATNNGRRLRGGYGILLAWGGRLWLNVESIPSDLWKVGKQGRIVHPAKTA